MFSNAHAAPPRGEVFWELFGHGSHGNVYPGEEPGPHMRSGGHEEPEWQVLAAAATTQGHRTKHRFFGLRMSKYPALACQKNVFYIDVYQTFLFIWLFKLFAPDKNKRAMTTLSQGQKISSPAAC